MDLEGGAYSSDRRKAFEVPLISESLSNYSC